MNPLEPGTVPTPDAFRVLSADDPAQAAEWLRLWTDWPDSEIMAHPDYVRLFARPGDQALAATYRGAQGAALYPLILRPLSLEPWARPDQAGCDLTTPYGYGGPYAWGLSPSECRDFWEHCGRWARSRAVVTAFARLSVFPEQLLPFDGDVVVNCPNILRRLDLTPDELWSDYEPKVRQNVRRARSRGCTLHVDPVGEHLDQFVEVYRSTMTRRNADSRYFFSREFFDGIARKLRGHFAFFHVFHGGRVVSSELVLLSKVHAYFFLGGSLAEALEVRPNDFLQHETFLWCRDAGKRRLVLGGGYKGSEGLLKYKKSFAPGGQVDFSLGMKTYDPELAADLLETRQRWEHAQGTPWSPEPGYFPAYRADAAA